MKETKTITKEINLINKKTITNGLKKYEFYVSKIFYSDHTFKYSFFISSMDFILKNANQKKKKRKNISFNVNTEKKISYKELNNFFIHFSLDCDLEKQIENKSFDFFKPIKTNIDFIKRTSIPYLIRKTNEERKNYIDLKIWDADEFSLLKTDELKELLNEEEVSITESIITQEHFSEKTRKKLFDKIFRWTLRGLNVDVAIYKTLKEYKSESRFFKKNYNNKVPFLIDTILINNDLCDENEKKTLKNNMRYKKRKVAF